MPSKYTCKAGGIGDLVQQVRQQPREELGQHRALGIRIRSRAVEADVDDRLRWDWVLGSRMVNSNSTMGACRGRQYSSWHWEQRGMSGVVLAAFTALTAAATSKVETGPC